MPRHDPNSKLHLIRDEAARVLREAGTALHVSEIAARVLPALGLAGEVTNKNFNTALHDDSRQRFLRVGKGTWELNPNPYPPR